MNLVKVKDFKYLNPLKIHRSVPMNYTLKNIILVWEGLSVLGPEAQIDEEQI